MAKKFLIFLLTFCLVSGSLTPLVSAEDASADVSVDESEDESTDDSADESEDESTDDSADESEDESTDDSAETTDSTDVPETEDLDEEVFYEEDDSDASSASADEEGEVIVEEVDPSDYSEESVDEFNSASRNGSSTSFYLSVRWGYFVEKGEERPDLELTNWDGVVDFNGSLALPIKLLRFEPNTDQVDFENSSAHETFFESDIYNATDGLLFKVKTDPSVESNIVFDTEGLGATVSTQDLLENGYAYFEDGDYAVVFKVWTTEDWMNGTVENEEIEEGVANDAVAGSWYEGYMNYSLSQGFFGGDRNPDGSPKGTIRPGDSLTRLEVIKVASELAFRLNLDSGLSAYECNPKEVTFTDETDWMGDAWARGYVQCIEDSGISVTLLDKVIDGSLEEASAPASRWEVVLTLFEVLGVDPSEGRTDLFPDLDEVSDEAAAAIEEAASLGVVAGYPDGFFRPDNEINRAEMFKIASLFYTTFSL